MGHGGSQKTRKQTNTSESIGIPEGWIDEQNHVSRTFLVGVLDEIVCDGFS